MQYKEQISTRAPTRGATGEEKDMDVEMVISTRAPTRGATPFADSSHLPSLFQPALPRGERQKINDVLLRDFYFNPRSHEGSDMNHTLQPADISYFNPRSHEGSDDTHRDSTFSLFKISTRAPTRGATKRAYMCIIKGIFQPALPRGERQLIDIADLSAIQFQPALPRGERRFRIVNDTHARCISTRAPTRGATHTIDSVQ